MLSRKYDDYRFQPTSLSESTQSSDSDLAGNSRLECCASMGIRAALTSCVCLWLGGVESAEEVVHEDEASYYSFVKPGQDDPTVVASMFVCWALLAVSRPVLLPHQLVVRANCLIDLVRCT
jgi:hypothetical protein